MELTRMPKPGEIYQHFKDKLYQIITVAIDSETGERMVVYQALYGDFKTYVRPLEMFVSEVDHIKYPEVKQKYRFERRKTEVENVEPQTKVEVDHEYGGQGENHLSSQNSLTEDTRNYTVLSMDNSGLVGSENIADRVPETNESVNLLLLKFLDASSYSKKLEVLTSNTKHLNDRLINDMAVSLDCSVDDGPLDKRISELVYCLQAMSRFEDRRLR